ncbi:hypothetical protein Tco_0227610 [Tanacetum coccineum]
MFHVSNLKKCYADEPLAVLLDGLHLDDKLHFVEEPLEIVGREVKRLKRSRIPLVKVRWNSKRGPEFTWEREDQFKKKYPHLFTKTASSSSAASILDKIMNDKDWLAWLVDLLSLLVSGQLTHFVARSEHCQCKLLCDVGLHLVHKEGGFHVIFVDVIVGVVIVVAIIGVVVFVTIIGIVVVGGGVPSIIKLSFVIIESEAGYTAFPTGQGYLSSFKLPSSKCHSVIPRPHCATRKYLIQWFKPGMRSSSFILGLLATCHGSSLCFIGLPVKSAIVAGWASKGYGMIHEDGDNDAISGNDDERATKPGNFYQEIFLGVLPLRGYFDSYCPKETIGEILPKEILGDTTQRDIGRYYPKRYWEILPKEILGDITLRDTFMVSDEPHLEQDIDLEIHAEIDKCMLRQRLLGIEGLMLEELLLWLIDRDEDRDG